MACVSKQPPMPIVRNHLGGAKSYCAFSHATRNFQTKMSTTRARKLIYLPATLRCIAPMGVNDMHATHVVAKIMYVYVQL